MLNNSHRFHGHNSLNYTYKNGETVRSPLLTMKYVVNKRRQNSRFAVVISKKVIKLAVRRNSLRRRIFEIVRHDLPQIKDHHDIIITAFSGEVFAMNHETLQALIKQLLSQANLYK